jgi:hypothetical protein
VSSPRPVTTGLFEEGSDGARLLAARCAACGRPHFPASTICPWCGADGCAAIRVGPAARLCLYTAVHTRPPGYQGEVPYGFGVVEMDGGLRVIGRLTETRLDRLRPGLPMRLVVTPLHTQDGETVSSYAFRPEAG